MSIQETPFRAEDSKPALPPEEKERYQRILETQAVKSYLYLSLGMGLLAFFLPIILVETASYTDHFSISYFYFASDRSRDIFVGVMYAIGVFLMLYHGLSKTENWILNAAGVAAVVLASYPMRVYGNFPLPDRWRQCPSDPGPWQFNLHAASASFFFLCLAVVAVFFAKDRVKHITDEALKLKFVAFYNVTGFFMIAAPIAVFALTYGDGCTNHHLFWAECTGIWAFAFFWFGKTYEYRRLLRVG